MTQAIRTVAIHTFAVDGGWVNQRDRSGAVRSVYPTSAEARRAGEDAARRYRTEHVVHARDGKIVSRHSFG